MTIRFRVAPVSVALLIACAALSRVNVALAQWCASTALVVLFVAFLQRESTDEQDEDAEVEDHD